MSEHLNVAQRLAEGASAVEHTQSYVRACHVLGYQHPDLTAYASQIRDWYDTEDGLNLWLLDDDCTKLRAAANAADEALTRQRAQHAELAESWAGPGAGAATEFLQRHCRAAEAVAANVHAAAERCAVLRDDLWRLVDAKAATAIAVDDRRLAERPAWLAAAQTVLAGAGDHSPADDLVDRQIKPYVDDDIRIEWLDAMRSTAASVDASFDSATDAVNAAPAPRFDVPGDLAAQSPPLDEPPARNDPVPVLPAGAAAVPAEPPPVGERPGGVTAPHRGPPAQPADVPAPAPAEDPLGSTLGDLGGLAGSSGAGGLSGLGGGVGGLGGIISQIVDAVGGLLGSLGDGGDGPYLTGDELNTDDPDHQLEADDSDKPVGPEMPEDPPASPSQVEDPAQPTADPAQPPEPAQPPDPAQPTADPAQPTADPAQPPPPPPEPAPPEPAPSPPEPRSPCEIAADELPQAGQ
jgi:hypothetical protein